MRKNSPFPARSDCIPPPNSAGHFSTWLRPTLACDARHRHLARARQGGALLRGGGRPRTPTEATSGFSWGCCWMTPVLDPTPDVGRLASCEANRGFTYRRKRVATAASGWAFWLDCRLGSGSCGIALDRGMGSLWSISLAGCLVALCFLGDDTPSIQVLCPSCEDLFSTRSRLDGAFFTTSLPHLLLLQVHGYTTTLRPCFLTMTHDGRGTRQFLI